MKQSYPARNGLSLTITLASLLTTALLVSACGPADQDAMQSEEPATVTESATMDARAAQAQPASQTLDRVVSHFDGEADDLLTAGLGMAGLLANAPAMANATQPTAAELRRLALYNAYRGLVDLRPNGGLAQWQRPDGGDALTPVAGSEILALRRLPGMQSASGVLLQIPQNFGWEQPCLVAAGTSGSRGIYGAVPVIAHWALPRGCAVVYSEKGTGNGVYFPASQQGYAVSGEVVAVGAAAFDPRPTDGDTQSAFGAYLEKHPYRVAFRHAHSGDNPEAHWGEFLIDAVHFALEELNAQRPAERDALHAGNTWIIATGISNGGGVAIAALEADDADLFDGGAVAEPNVQVTTSPSLYTSSAVANLYAYCAIQAVDPQSHPLAGVLAFQTPLFQARCTHLAELGLLDAAAETSLPQQALEKIHEAGYPPAADPLLAFSVAYDLYPAIAATYAYTYGRFAFDQPPCGIGFAFTAQNGVAEPVPDGVAATLYATSSGVPPTAGIQLVKSTQTGEDKKTALVPGVAAQPDGDLAGALCHYALNATAPKLVTPGVLPDVGVRQAEAVAQGIAAVQRSGDLRGRPVYIVHGAADSVVPVAHSSRAYVALNQQVEGERSQLHYTEVEKAQHFDALLALPGYQEHYEGLHGYYLQALDELWQQRR